MTNMSVEEFMSAVLEMVNRGKKRTREQVIEPVTEPLTIGEMLPMERNMQEMMTRGMEKIKREFEQMKREFEQMKREFEQMKREFEQMKREREEMLKRMSQTSSTQGAPADLNESPRFCRRTPPDSLTRKSEEVESPTYVLKFVNKLHNTIFTKDKIKDKNGGFVEIKLIDTSSRQIVEEGSLSSMEIMIHVLPGDFGSKANEEWTEQEFIEKIIVEKADRAKLVKGKPNITLRNGVGTMDNFIFLDNSSWIPSKMVRLGARVLRRPSNMSQVIRIKEAITEPFAVRDHRGKSNHLKKIVKDGIILHEALIRHNIRTISDLKQIYKTNRDKLKEMLGRCSDSEWAAIAQFAVEDANSNPSPPSQVAEAYNPATTGLMQTENNRASSSHHHSEFQPEIVQNLASHGRPLSTIGDNSSENCYISNQNNNAPMNLECPWLTDDFSADCFCLKDLATVDCTLSM